jgi:AAT family amino acid transporter
MPSSLPSDSPTTTWWTHGLANLVIVLIATFIGWYLLTDPKTSPLDVYPLPFNAALFWALLFIVWSGFNLEFAGFTRLAQPLRGLAITVATAVFAIGVTYGFAKAIGHFYPDFAASRDGGTGYFTAALFVLFGFSTWVLVVINWAHWPWPDLGLKQPLVGFCEIAFLILPTTLLWLVLGVPAVSETVRSGTAVIGIDTLLGWYYSIIVAVVVTGLTMDNWPWRLAGSRARVALASLLGNIALGTLTYVVLLGVCKLIIGHDTVAELGSVIHQFPSQLGVCWVAWMIMWANAFGNKPTGLGDAANLVARVIITFGLAVITFVLYYYVLAEHLLHEPLVAGKLHGNALGFMDWFALITLLYVVGFESYGLRKPAPEDGIDDLSELTLTTDYKEIHS